MSTSRAIKNFAVIGGIGFTIEATLLTAITKLLGWTPWQARIPSFLTAVSVTWLLNRQYTFPGRGLEHRSLEAFSYAAIQVCGAVINLIIFGVCLNFFPQLSSAPVVPLAVGSVGGLIFNFTVNHVILYSRSRTGDKK